MSRNWPIDPIGGDSGWANYSFWLVSYKTSQGQQDKAVMFAASANDAIAALKSDKNFLALYGPLTNVSAAPTAGPGLEAGGN